MQAWVKWVFVKSYPRGFLVQWGNDSPIAYSNICGRSSMMNTMYFPSSTLLLGNENFRKYLVVQISHNAFWNSQTHSVNDSIYDFDRVFLENPVKNALWECC